FAARIGIARSVSFRGRPNDFLAELAHAEVVWVPSVAEGGVSVALEAMAAGRAVVASRLPGLAEGVADGETGLLARPGDVVSLARQTRVLLDDPERRRRMGRAGRERVGRHFAADNFVRRLAQVYDSAA